MGHNRFTTLDIYLAAYLSLNGCRPDLVTQGGKVIFAFPHQDANRLIEQFNSNSLVAVADFTTAVKTLRGRMLQVKGPAL